MACKLIFGQIESLGCFDSLGCFAHDSYEDSTPDSIRFQLLEYIPGQLSLGSFTFQKGVSEAHSIDGCMRKLGVLTPGWTTLLDRRCLLHSYSSEFQFIPKDPRSLAGIASVSFPSTAPALFD